MFFLRLLVVLFGSVFILCCLPTFTNGAALEKSEVDALRSIGRTLGKDWNFSDDIDPCSPDRDKSWEDEQPSYGYVNNVTCDCSFNNNTVCHVLHIQLKGQNLSGLLPKDLPSLPFLQEIDLTRNYLNGTIPPSWGNATRLVNITLLGNRLTGSIPEQLASLTNLTSLVLESNDFSGNLPPALGNLPKLERLLLASNKFTGEIPETFASLTSMKEFRISDNNFTGRIPEYMFGGWIDIKRM